LVTVRVAIAFKHERKFSVRLKAQTMAEAARRFYDEYLKEDERKRVYVEKKRKLTPQQKFIKQKLRLFYPKPRLSLQAISEASSPFPHTFDPKSWSLPEPFQKEGFLFSSPRFIQKPAEFAYAPFDFRKNYPAGMRSHIHEEEEVLDEYYRLVDSKEIKDYVADVIAGDDVKIDYKKVSKLEPHKALSAVRRAIAREFDRQEAEEFGEAGARHEEEIAEWVEKELTRLSLM